MLYDRGSTKVQGGCGEGQTRSTGIAYEASSRHGNAPLFLRGYSEERVTPVATMEVARFGPEYFGLMGLRNCETTQRRTWYVVTTAWECPSLMYDSSVFG